MPLTKPLTDREEILALGKIDPELAEVSISL